jgi:mannose-1-phosphate guanylyltransferase
LWPLSRQLVPKQFLSITGDNTLLQDTVIRLAGLDLAAPILVCHEDHRFSVAGQLSTLGFDHQGIILEPVGRNTAPQQRSLYSKHWCWLKIRYCWFCQQTM